MPDDDVDRPVREEARSSVPVEHWEVNEQLILGRLREHVLADQLEHQLTFSRAIAGSLAEGVCAIDGVGKITFVNPAAERLLGWQDADLRTRDAHTTLYGPNAATSHEASPFLTVLRTGVTYRDDGGTFVRNDGTSFPVAYSVAPLVVDAHVAGVIVAFNDLTDVQRLYQMQEDYVALLSHDLGAPLTTILGYAELLVRHLRAGALERATLSAETIVISGKKMKRLLQEVLERTRIPPGHAALRLTPVDLVALVARSVDQNLLPTARARVEMEAVAHLPVVVDPVQLERVVANLLTNACKYSASASPVVVRVFRTDRDAMISVTDQGVGIGTEDLPHLFEKYFRAGTAGAVEGTGLGLYGSRLIVEAHGGRIWAQSTVGMGSTFLVSIPLSESPLPADGPEQTSR